MLTTLSWYWSAAGIAYPLGILCYISYDMIVMYFPRRLALATDGN